MNIEKRRMMQFSLAAAIASSAILGIGSTQLHAQDTPAASSIRTDESRTQIRGFADFNLVHKNGEKVGSSFGLGQYDLYITSQLSDRVSFIGETVFEYKAGFVVEVERAIVTFAPQSFFRIAAGKHHTPIGYWNTAYHHGKLLQPTIDRPQMIRHEGGVLPTHTTGVLVSGRNISSAHLGYDFMVGNGIGSTPTQDNNTSKSYTMALTSEVTSALAVGSSLYLDRIETGSLGRGGQTIGQNIDVRLAGGYLVYSSPSIEIIAEYQRSDYRGRANGEESNTDAIYAYAGYRIGRVVPYFRVDQIDLSESDQFHTSSDYRQALIGTRFDFAATSVIKLEAARQRLRNNGSRMMISAQLAVGF